jgi:uncharacterized protein (TIGR03437 family)
LLILDMLRSISLALAITMPALAQFSSMATPADGSRVYFATGLRQQGTSQPLSGKLFVIDSTGLALFRSDSGSATISSDGKVFAFSSTVRTTISTGGQDQDYPGDLRLSAGGKWAFGLGTQSPTPLFTAYLVNVATGDTTTFAHNVFQIARNGRAVADDGTVVYSDFNSIVVQRGSDIRHITVPGATAQPQDAVIDAAGDTIVFTVGASLYLGDGTLFAADGFTPTLSDDGKTLLYLSNRTGSTQIRIARLGAGLSLDRQLGFVIGGVSSVVLSGDGSVVYAVAKDGRLLKVAATTGTAQELIPRTPHLTGSSQFAPGKLVTLSGGGLTGLSFVADAPLPVTINGISVSVQGKPARMLSVTPDAILMIVPPDVTPNPQSTVDVTLPSTSPFDSSTELVLDIQPSAPEFVPIVAHQDWTGLVTADSPARPGEVLHTYGVGFGATSPAVAYGNAAPAQEPFARITSPFTCDGTALVPVETFYQGLAPNFVGVYQFDFRVPANTPAGPFTLRCVQGGQTIYANVPVAAQ